MAGRALVVRAALALAASAAFGVVITAPIADRSLVVAVDDLGQLTAACLAVLACAGAARRAGADLRTAWWLVAAGTASWALGQGVWSAYELVVRQEAPFPSGADVGFLLFPVLATAGLMCGLSASAPASRVRVLLDGAITATSVLTLSWVTVIEAIRAGGGGSALSVALSYAYPVGDIVLTTLVLLTLVRTSGALRHALLLVGAGLGAIAVADSAYLLLIATGDYASGDLVSVGWVLGFLWIAVGARTAGSARASTGADAAAHEQRPTTRLHLVLPYLPVVVAEGTVVAQAVTDGGVSDAGVVLSAVLVLLVLLRQFSAMTDNRRLVVELSVARDQMRHLALHDPLTGLPNRALFRDRVEHALALRPGAGTSVAVIFCDLDGFKAVNDGGGHAVGDALLCTVADRIRGALRPADTVARLGGDEFAVLLEDPSDPMEVAERLLAAVSQPCLLHGSHVAVTMSAGVAVHEHSSVVPETEASLVRRADTAMYRAKAAGKGGVVLADAGRPAGAPVTA